MLNFVTKPNSERCHNKVIKEALSKEDMLLF